MGCSFVAALNILFVGDLRPGTTSAQRANALERCGYEVTQVPTAGKSRNSKSLLDVRWLLMCANTMT